MSLSTRLDSRANALNAVRLVLATLVIVSHSWVLGGFGTEPTFGGATLGTWAVYGFFGLSGLLITASRIKSDAMSYLKRRILRIYPAFIACQLVTVTVFAPIGYYRVHHTLHGYLGAPHSPLNYLISNLGLRIQVYDVSGGPTGLPYKHAWNGSLWSLYWEFLCYLIVGVVGCWATFRRRPAVAVIMFVLASAAAVQSSTVMRYAQAHEVKMLLGLLPFFLAGSVLTMLSSRIPSHWCLAAVSAAAAIAIPFVTSDRYTVLVALPITYVLTWLGAVLPVKIGRRNDISYGLYIYGFPVQQLLALWGLPAHGHAQYLAASIAAAIPFAVASWFFVERPILRRAHQRPRIYETVADGVSPPKGQPIANPAELPAPILTGS